MSVPSVGNANAKIAIVGDFPTTMDIYRNEPLTSDEVTKMLHEAGIIRTECYLTLAYRGQAPANIDSVWSSKKKDQKAFGLTKFVDGYYCTEAILAMRERLHEELNRVKPNVVVAFGNFALWMLTGVSGILSWRGSLCQTPSGIKVIATNSPKLINVQWELRALAVHDLRYALLHSEFPELPVPAYNFTIRPSLASVLSIIGKLTIRAMAGPLHISVDIETRSGHMACVGFAWSRLDALCIPLMCTENPEGYWTLEEELLIWERLRTLLTHPNVRVSGQNFSYDAQYFAKEWGFVPNLTDDSMLAHHVCFAGMPKSLGFLASLYCEHRQFWKDEGKTWDPSLPEEQLWTYNCKDTVNTFEIVEVLQTTIDQLRLRAVYAFQMQLWKAVFRMMLRGVRIDQPGRSTMAGELFNAIAAREQLMYDILGFTVNPGSPKQMQDLFYSVLAQKPIISRKTKRITCDDDALKTLEKREPLLKLITKPISEIRSLGVFLKTFVQAPLDTDKRMRCSYNIAGTETFRFNSSANAFDSGTNLQNIPKGVEKPKPGELALPNIRKLFIPDPGFIIFDMDLDRADLQVVVWEADDEDLKKALREGLDLHLLNAQALFNLPFGIDDLRDPTILAQLLKRYARERQFAKSFVHGTNYGGSPRTMAIASGTTIAEAERAQNLWFRSHPGIKEWHHRTEQSLIRERCVTNKFGYRRFYFERIEGLLPEALAWQPQSTVAIVCNKVLEKIDSTIPEVNVLLQVHDSLVNQAHKSVYQTVKPKIKAITESIIIPYDDPLCIPWGVKSSEKSWGDVTDDTWN